MRAIAAIALILAACGGTTAPTSIPASEFCAALVAATCDREGPCGTFPDRATCVTQVTDAFDACPPAIEAIALQETEYDPQAAPQYLNDVRMTACGSAVDIPLEGENAVFTPKQGAGELCHSKVSCTAGLLCVDDPLNPSQGFCTAVTTP
jgi:hypothetical protein